MNIIYLQKRQSDKCVSNDIIYEFEQTIINDTKFLKNSRNWIEKIAFIFSLKFQSIFKLFSREKINQTFSMLMGTGDFYLNIKSINQIVHTYLMLGFKIIMKLNYFVN